MSGQNVACAHSGPTLFLLYASSSTFISLLSNAIHVQSLLYRCCGGKLFCRAPHLNLWQNLLHCRMFDKVRVQMFIHHFVSPLDILLPAMFCIVSAGEGTSVK